ncbi:MAG: TRAP transporter small permease [Desulfuromonadales bacterium]|nr:TRAP transporter small permease [Desulfuromonadales bacterium]MBN2792533.1 TRAP transporter small permease [Desulfuromonadales bacterium]
MKTFLKKLCRVINRISEIGELLTEIMIVVLALMIFYEVIARYIFRNPSVYTVEISEYIMIFITFISAGWVLQQDRHINMTILVDRLSSKARSILKVLTSSITMAYCLVIIWKSVRTVLIAYNGDYHSASAVNFPLWIVYFFIPLGISILFLQYISVIYEEILFLNGKGKIESIKIQTLKNNQISGSED